MSHELKNLQDAIAERKYIRNIEIYRSYDFTQNRYYTNLLLTLTDDDVFFEHKLRIRFTNISDLKTDNLCSMVRPCFVIYDLTHRYKLIDEEHHTLSFFFEKAEITS